jgi:soluble lytic murein transglycosylase-like protein
VKLRTIALVALAVGVCLPATAQADIVRLTNGRTLVVDNCEFDGDTVLLSLRGGGEIKANKSIIDEILPDEVPYARAVIIEALETARALGRPVANEAVFQWVEVVATRMSFDPRLAHAIVRAESNYNPYAVSPKGAMGLMQLMPATAKQYGVGTSDLFDVERNLETGLRHFRYLMQQLGGDLRLALAAYNAGEGAVARYGGVPPYRETQNYVLRIMSVYAGG